MNQGRDFLSSLGQHMRREVVCAKVRFQHTQHPPIPVFCRLTRAEKTLRAMIRWLARGLYLKSIVVLQNTVRNYARLRRSCTDVQTGAPLHSQIVRVQFQRDIRNRALDAFSGGLFSNFSPLRSDEDERTFFSPQLLDEEDWDTWDPDSPSTVD